jgi:hypothetical protein
MEIKRWVAHLSFCALLTMLPLDFAEAATGTLKFSFKYKDPITGVVSNLPDGYVYLRDASKAPPMENTFSKADYIDQHSFGNGNYGSGSYVNPDAPVGTWYIRITQRKVQAGGVGKFGPPVAGDYTWKSTTPITITVGQTLDLGTLYASLFSPPPITISGTVKSASGTPLEGQYVRAQTEPCLVPLNCTDTGCEQYGNQCSPNKYLALRKTDSAGKYTLLLAAPGTYYLYSSPCLIAGHNENDPSRCWYSAAPAPVTVIDGESKTVDIVVN